MDVPFLAWAALSAGVVAVLALDLALFHRRERRVGMREAAAWTVVWLVVALAFAVVVHAWLGGTAATEYLAGYVIERSLSIDNVFVLVALFAWFAVPPGARHRALVWGVVGALGLRLLFILAGAVALERFAWTAYVLGAFLVGTGARLALREPRPNPGRNPVVRAVGRFVPSTPHYDGQRLFTRDGGRLLATPLVVVMVAVATTDVAFAADSIPAVYAVTDEPFLVYATNAFALLGLMALYALLAAAVDRVRTLRPALAAILVLVGLKMAFGGLYEVPVAVSLGVVAGILALALLPALPSRFHVQTRVPGGAGR